jgi:D-glycero-alpha-D-manno-heptose 1-phosphate guanylyltransferase
MEAIVLAGGLGTRLSSSIPSLPKTLAPIGEVPFLKLILNFLRKQGVNKIVFALGHRSEQVVSYLESSPRFEFEYIYSVEELPLGTGGAIQKALEQCDLSPVLILNGDTFVEFDLADALTATKGSNAVITTRLDDARRYGQVLSKGNKVIAFSRDSTIKKASVSTGAYLVENKLMRNVTLHPPFSFEADFLTNPEVASTFQSFEIKGRFIDIGIPEDFQKAQEYLSDLV